jgi:hypothetical protein
MQPPGGYRSMLASRERRRVSHCDHESAPVLVRPVPDGYQAQCLTCGMLGPVCESSEVARLGLLGDRDEHRS